MCTSRILLTGILALTGLAPSAAAQRGKPASLLLFPEYDSRSGLLNLITVTNIDETPGAEVLLQWEFIDGAFCTRHNRTTSLASGDTLTVVASSYNPFPSQGYLYVYAKDDASSPIVHNQLIGTSTILDGLGNLEYTVEPYTFLGVGPAGSSTDTNGNGRRDLNGTEYSTAGDSFIFPRFLGQTASRTSELILVDLTGGPGYDTYVNMFWYNDNSQIFSVQHIFQCWEKVPLQSVSTVSTNDFLANFTVHDPDEVIGLPSMETGWFEVDGYVTEGANLIFNPAIVALLVESTVTGRSSSSHPAFVGSQTNGSLFPSGSANLPTGGE